MSDLYPFRPAGDRASPQQSDKDRAIEHARRLLNGEVDSLSGMNARVVCEQLLRALALPA